MSIVVDDTVVVADDVEVVLVLADIAFDHAKRVGIHSVDFESL